MPILYHQIAKHLNDNGMPFHVHVQAVMNRLQDIPEVWHILQMEPGDVPEEIRSAVVMRADIEAAQYLDEVLPKCWYRHRFPRFDH